MPASSHDPANRDSRARARAQLQSMRDAIGDDFAYDTDDMEDYNHLFVKDSLLVAAGDDEQRFLDAFARRRGDLRSMPDPVAPLAPPAIPGLLAYQLDSGRDDPLPGDVVDVVNVMNEELGPGVVSLEHFVHLAGGGNGRACPATEPAETGLAEAWPPKAEGEAGTGVKVMVVDTGWVNASAGGGPTQLDEYDGHGSFAEAVIRCRAPGADVDHLAFPMQGGAVSEYVLADLLRQAVESGVQVVNLSAGCHTWDDQPLKAFERVWNDLDQDQRDGVAIVAAAGNDASPLPFYPAASDWAFGVGSLDHDDEVSAYSNYRRSADVFVLGRNHVNEFPNGEYTCRWAPDVGDRRVFTNGLARWSGTSFAAPLLAGMIAAHIPEFGGTVREAAADLIRQKRVWRNHPVFGVHRVIELAQVF